MEGQELGFGQAVWKGFTEEGGEESGCDGDKSRDRVLFPISMHERGPAPQSRTRGWLMGVYL